MIHQAGKMVEVFDGLSKTTEVTATAMKAAGSAANEVRVRLETAEVSVNRFKAGFENLGIAIGLEFLEATKEAVRGGSAIEETLQNVVKGDTFDPVFSRIRSFGEEFGDFLEGIAAAMPEAFEKVEFEGLLTSLDNLKGSFKGTFQAIFGDLDLTKPEDLAKAIQKVVDTITTLTNITGGIIDRINPLIEMFVNWTGKVNDWDTESQKAFGNRLADAMIIEKFGGIVGSVLIGLTGDAKETHEAMQAMEVMGDPFAKVTFGAEDAADAIGEIPGEVDALKGSLADMGPVDIVDPKATETDLDEVYRMMVDAAGKINEDLKASGGAKVPATADEESINQVKTILDQKIPKERKVEVDLEKERIKAQAEIITATIEAETEKWKTMFESVNTGIESTGDVLKSFWETLAGGGTSDQARMQQLAARYGWQNYGTQYVTSSGNYNYANIWGSISEMNLTPERVQAIADFLGLDYETVAGDMQYLASAFGNMKAEAESLGTSLEQEYNQITMSSADYGRWQATSNFETTVEKLDLWLDQGIISEQEFQRMLGMATTIYDHQMAAANALEDAAEEQKAATAALKSACESFDEIERSWEAKLEGSAYKQQVMGVEDELESYRERIRNVADAYYEETGKVLKIDWNYVESNLSAIRAKEIKDIQKSFYDPFRANLEDVLDSHELTEMEQALKKANAWYSEQAEILEELQEFLSAAEYQQQLDDLNQAWAYMLEDMVEETENAWEGVAESISDTLRSLETSTANPADAIERLAIAAQAIKDYTGGMDIASYLDTLGTDAERRSAIEKLMTLYGDYWTAGQAAYDRPSDERTAIYNEVKTAFQTMETLAQGYADEYEVQVAQLEALHQLVINTTGLGSYAGGTESIDKTGFYWLHKGETKILPAGKSSEPGVLNMNFGDINLYGITDGDDLIKKFRAYLKSPSGQQDVYNSVRFRVS